MWKGPKVGEAQPVEGASEKPCGWTRTWGADAKDSSQDWVLWASFCRLHQVPDFLPNAHDEHSVLELRDDDLQVYRDQRR